jgi:hypothetical protein
MAEKIFSIVQRKNGKKESWNMESKLRIVPQNQRPLQVRWNEKDSTVSCEFYLGLGRKIK